MALFDTDSSRSTAELDPGSNRMIDDFDRDTLHSWLAGVDDVRNGIQARVYIPTVLPGKWVEVRADNAAEVDRHLRESFAYIEPDLLLALQKPEYTQAQIETRLAEVMGKWTMEEMREAATPQHAVRGASKQVGLI